MELEIVFALTITVVLLPMIFLSYRLGVLGTPHQIQVISGRKNPDHKRGYRLHSKGLTARIPFIEKVDTLDTTLLPVEMSIEDVKSADGARLNIEFDAFITVDRSTDRVHEAVETFLGLERDEMIDAVKAMLEEPLRQGLASLTAEEIQKDRLATVREASHAADSELKGTGLLLQSLQPQMVDVLSKPRTTPEAEVMTGHAY